MHTRREFLLTASASAVAAAMPGMAFAQERTFAPAPGTWRTFEITTKVELLNPKGATRVWLPVPSIQSNYQRSGDNRVTGNAKNADIMTDTTYGTKMLVADFAEGEAAPVVELTSRFQTQSRAVNWKEKTPASADASELKQWLKATDFMPTDGIVLKTAQDVTKGAKTDYEKVQAIYNWVIANTYREPKVRGCGTGDIKAMLETGNMGGKCGDINALFVGLARASGVPARDVYGIRLVPSAFGYKELSGNPAKLQSAQ
ncbi:MAG: transglutaminase-like domain-containing protein, partial [Burkholderiaceae bacterium]